MCLFYRPRLVENLTKKEARSLKLNVMLSVKKKKKHNKQVIYKEIKASKKKIEH